MLNINLAIARGLSRSEVKDLVALHVAMDMMVLSVNKVHAEESIHKGPRKLLRKNVRRLEYLMQDIWGFDRNKGKHTHWKRFNCLNPTTGTTVRS